MREFTWSPTQKKAARAAFDLALAKELKAIRQKIEDFLRNSRDDDTVWRIHDYLSKRRRDIEQKYDFRYSVLIFVFSRLVAEGWLTTNDLEGIGSEKVDAVSTVISISQGQDRSSKSP